MNKIITKKIDKQYFEQILSGQKTFELRLADWECRPGDTLELVEIEDKTHQQTGRTIRKKVGTVTKTNDLDFWPKEAIEQHGYQIISLLEEV